VLHCLTGINFAFYAIWPVVLASVACVTVFVAAVRLRVTYGDVGGDDHDDDDDDDDDDEEKDRAGHFSCLFPIMWFQNAGGTIGSFVSDF